MVRLLAKDKRRNEALFVTLTSSVLRKRSFRQPRTLLRFGCFYPRENGTLLQTYIKEKTDLMRSVLTLTSSVLFSRAVASQVFSTMRSLTSVFGMGTGGTFSLSPLVMV